MKKPILTEQEKAKLLTGFDLLLRKIETLQEMLITAKNSDIWPQVLGPVIAIVERLQTFKANLEYKFKKGAG